MDQQYTVPPPRHTPAQQHPRKPYMVRIRAKDIRCVQLAAHYVSSMIYRIAPLHLRQHPSSPSLLVQHLPHDSLLSVNNSLWSPAPELPVTASDSFIPDDDPDSPVEVQPTTFRQPTAAFSVAVKPPASRRRAPAPTPGPASQPPDDTIPDAIEFEVI
ncbi:hypothetical protein R3P38DRAFT_3247734 [Favolaschia claudopus]|uniref:Uncharacterized protein n=1 Tax=Favolaschia claudopus TaxID=2862362 RepID=A0AAV9YYC5_9AGAR